MDNDMRIKNKSNILYLVIFSPARLDLEVIWNWNHIGDYTG